MVNYDRNGKETTTASIFVEDSLFLQYYSIPGENRSETLHRILLEYADDSAKKHVKEKMKSAARLEKNSVKGYA